MDASAQVQPGCEAWEADGSGDRSSTVAVIVHGFTGNPIATTPLGKVLNEAGFGVRVVRLPGHGTSVKDMARTRYPDWRAAADEAVGAAFAAGATKVVYVGHSMGGTIGLDIVSSRPDVAGLVAINPQIRDPEQLLAKLAPLLQYLVPIVPRDLGGLPTNDIAKPGSEESAYPKIPARSAQSLIGNLGRIRSQLPKLTQPMLLVTSPQDHTVPAKNSDTVAELVGSADLQRVSCPNSYHIPQIDFDQELVEEAVLAFVEKVHAG